MEKLDYKYVFTTSEPVTEALEAIGEVQDWWASDFEGSSKKVDDEFTVHFDEVYVTFQIIEMIPDQHIVWLVTDCFLDWVKDKKEWKGTKIIWEVTSLNDLTRVSMTHLGLVPTLECYNDCRVGWDFHIGTSLYKLINEGVGIPDVSTRYQA